MPHITTPCPLEEVSQSIRRDTPFISRGQGSIDADLYHTRGVAEVAGQIVNVLEGLQYTQRTKNIDAESATMTFRNGKHAGVGVIITRFEKMVRMTVISNS